MQPPSFAHFPTRENANIYIHSCHKTRRVFGMTLSKYVIYDQFRGNSDINGEICKDLI